jgi:hypothetical protein
MPLAGLPFDVAPSQPVTVETTQRAKTRSILAAEKLTTLDSITATLTDL